MLLDAVCPLPMLTADWIICVVRGFQVFMSAAVQLMVIRWVFMRCAVLVYSFVSEELTASIFRVTGFGSGCR